MTQRLTPLDEIDTGHEHIATATMYRKMDMRFWLEQAEAELKALK